MRKDNAATLTTASQRGRSRRSSQPKLDVYSEWFAEAMGSRKEKKMMKIPGDTVFHCCYA